MPNRFITCCKIYQKPAKKNQFDNFIGIQRVKADLLYLSIDLITYPKINGLVKFIKSIINFSKLINQNLPQNAFNIAGTIDPYGENIFNIERIIKKFYDIDKTKRILNPLTLVFIDGDVSLLPSPQSFGCLFLFRLTLFCHCL